MLYYTIQALLFCQNGMFLFLFLPKISLIFCRAVKRTRREEEQFTWGTITKSCSLCMCFSGAGAALFSAMFDDMTTTMKEDNTLCVAMDAEWEKKYSYTIFCKYNHDNILMIIIKRWRMKKICKKKIGLKRSFSCIQALKYVSAIFQKNTGLVHCLKKLKNSSHSALIWFIMRGFNANQIKTN